MTYSNDSNELTQEEIELRLEQIMDKLEDRPLAFDLARTSHYYVFYEEDVRFLLNLLNKDQVHIAITDKALNKIQYYAAFSLEKAHGKLDEGSI